MAMIHEYGAFGGMGIGRRNRSIRKKTLSSIILSLSSICPDLRSNHGPLDKKLATNHLS
jgi:hypothetical protein